MSSWLWPSPLPPTYPPTHTHKHRGMSVPEHTCTQVPSWQFDQVDSYPDISNFKSFLVLVILLPYLRKLSRVRLFATLWTVARQAPLSMGFPRQEYWSGFPFLSPGDLPDPRIEPRSPAWKEDSLPLSHQGSHNFCYTEGNTSKTLLWARNLLLLGLRLECRSQHSWLQPSRNPSPPAWVPAQQQAQALASHFPAGAVPSQNAPVSQSSPPHHCPSRQLQVPIRTETPRAAVLVF